MSALPDAASDFAAELVARATRAGADAAQVTVSHNDYFEIDFSARSVDLLRSTANESAAITVFRGGKRGSAQVNGRDPDNIEAALSSALLGAEAGIADPANDVANAPSLPKSQHGSEAPHKEAMIAAVRGFIDDLGQLYPNVRTRNSIYAFNRFETGFANSLGVTQAQARGYYRFGAMFSAKDGRETTSFNYSGAASFSPFERLLSVGSVNRLLDETLQSFHRRSVPEKFVGDVIITPDCMHSLMGTIAHALSGAALFAGTSPYKDRRGEQIAAPCFSLLNRPRSDDFPHGSDFDGFGVPTQDLDVVKDGVLNEFLVDYFMARKLNRPQTASAHNFVVLAGDTPVAEMIAKTKRGILFSRFSGGSPNSNLDFSGVAKNSFYIEDGEVKYPLGETMVSGNFQELLQQIHTISKESINFGDASHPFVAASGVTISGR